MARSTISMPRHLIRDFGTCLDKASNGICITASPWSTKIINFGMGIWFKSDNYRRNRQPLISNGSSALSNTGYALVLSGDATTDGSIYILNHSVAWQTCNFKVSDNEWHSILLAVNGAGLATIYLDGLSKYSGTPTLGTPSANSALGNDGSAVFPGLLDEAKFFDYCPTANEALNMHYGVNPTVAPLDWYKLDEGSGTSAVDSGTGGKTMTLTNDTWSTNVFMKPRIAVS